MAEARKDSATRTLGIKAAKGTLIYTIGNIVGSLAILLLLIILARLLDASDFGLYAIAIAFYNLLAGHFVFGTVIRKEIPQEKDDKKRIAELISNGYFISLLVALAVSLVAMLLSNFIAVSIYHNPGISSSLLLASALVFFYALFNLTLAVLIAVDKAKEGTIIYLIYAFVQLFASVALVLAGYGVFGAIAGMGISLIIPSTLGIYWIYKHVKGRFVAPNRKLIGHMLDFSAPVLASNIALFAPPNIAILLLGVYESAIVVGNYNAAYRFGSFVSVILVSISFVLLPAFSKAFSDKNIASKIGRIYNSSVHYTLMLLLPVLIYVVSVAHPLLYLLFTSKYNLAPFYFAVIALGSAIGIISIYASNLQIGYGDTRRFMYYQLLAVAIQIALLFALTPLLGVNGVLLALFVISQILIDIIYVYALYRQFSFKHEFKPLLGLIIPAALLLILLYVMTGYLHNSKWSLITNLAAVVILFPPLAALFGGVEAKNIEFLRDIAKSLKVSFIAKYILDYAQFFIRKERA